jgi:tRNA nucleotidyltransferase (CCA-adding enzyme)
MLRRLRIIPETTVDTRQSLTAYLSPEQRSVYDAVLATAQAQHVELYLVGGAVRDWLMRQPIGDLDFVVEGDAIPFAQAVRAAHGGELQSYEKFRTATWTSFGLHTDIATARVETYPRPAILPVVRPATLREDLSRRDFTVNALALRLNDALLLDPFNGRPDLGRRVIRALHARSFIDDPTRMWRAARYATRFGFQVEPATREWIDAGLPYVKDLSGERVKYDQELIYDLPAPELALNLLAGWGVFRALGIAVPEPAALAQRFERARMLLARGEWDTASLGLAERDLSHAVAWGALTYDQGQMSTSRWVALVPFTSEVRDALVSLGALSTLSALLFTGKASWRSELLHLFGGLALLMGWLYDANDQKRHAMFAQWHTWRKVQPVCNGAALRARGLPPGPRYRELLTRLRTAWLDGEVNTPEGERALLDRLLEGRD